MVDVHTRYWRVDTQKPEPEIIQAAVDVIKKGGLVAFPTETVYGLGADALDGRVVRRVFGAKGRPVDNPLTLHVAGPEEAFIYVKYVPEQAWALAGAFWPGPLTLILPLRGGLPAEVTGGRSGLGVRIPDHPVALALIKSAARPLVAPSANISGRPSPTTAKHVMEDLDGRINVVLDGGPTGWGLESTVIDLTGERPVMLRPGVLTPEDLAPVIGVVDTAGGQVPAGKYSHYQPRAELWLVEGEDVKEVAAQMQELAGQHQRRGREVGLLVYREDVPFFSGFHTVVAGSRSNPATVASELFNAVRRLDKLGVDIIICAGFTGSGLGMAIQNRLRLAAGNKIIKI